MNATRLLAPFVALGAFALVGGGTAGAQTETASRVTVVVVTAPPQATSTTTTTTITTTTTTTKLGATVSPRVVTCENARNHGEWVSSRPKAERAAAARSDCGKPHRPTSTLLGQTVTTKPTSTSSSVPSTVTSTTNPRDGHDEQGEDGKGKGKGNNGRNNDKAKGKH